MIDRVFAAIEIYVIPLVFAVVVLGGIIIACLPAQTTDQLKAFIGF